MNTRYLLLALFAASTILYTSVDASKAQQRRPGLKHQTGTGIARLLMKFDLSDEQKATIANAVQESHEQMRAGHEAVMQSRKNLHEQAEADTIDEQAIKNAAQSLGEAIGNLTLLRAKMRTAVLSALTAEQREVLEDERAQRKERRAQRRAERSERGPSMLEEWVERHASE